MVRPHGSEEQSAVRHSGRCLSSQQEFRECAKLYIG